MNEPLSIWPDWELLELLDSGSSGVVYRAVHRGNPGLQSAVKLIYLPPDEKETAILRGQGLTDEQLDSHYRKEAEACEEKIRRLELFKGTSHIVSLEDFRILPQDGETGYIVCIRMELLKNLNQYLCDKTLNEDDVLRIGIDLCSALEICHREGVLHGDIKPENIFVNDRLSSGVLFKLGDFGSAVESEKEEVISGTPMYIAPEAAAGKTADERSDIYCLGLTLYRLMNRDRLPFLPADKPFYSHEEKAVAVQIRLSGIPFPPPEQASDEFFAVLRKACAFEPDQRYATAAEFGNALIDLRKKHQRADSYRRVRMAMHHPAFLILVALLCFILLTGLGSLLFHRNDTDPATVTPAPLLPAVTELPGDPLSDQTDYMLQSLRHYGIISADSIVYRVPLSADKFPVRLFLQEVMPGLAVDFSAFPASLELSDGSSSWMVLLELEDGSTVSFKSQDSLGRYAAVEPLPRIPERYSWLLSKTRKGDWDSSIEGFYTEDSTSPHEVHWEIESAEGTGRIVWVYCPFGEEDIKYQLRLESKGRLGLVASYNDECRLTRIDYAGNTYPIDLSGGKDNSSPIIEGVEWIQ